MTDVEFSNIISNNSTEIAAGVGGLAIGGALGAVAGYRAGSKKSKRRKVSKSRSIRKRSSRSKSRTKRSRTRKTPHTAGKRKDTSHKRIRYTSKGQPYIIKANGRAQFIKKKSAKSSHKRKGGRY